MFVHFYYPGIMLETSRYIFDTTFRELALLPYSGDW